MARINTGGGWTATTTGATPGLIYDNMWTWTIKTADAGTAGQVGANAATWAAVTVVNVNQQAQDNTDATNAFGKLKAGDGIYLQHALDATRYARYELTAVPADQGTWWMFPVKLNAAIGASGAIPGGNTNTVVRLIGNL